MKEVIVPEGLGRRRLDIFVTDLLNLGRGSVQKQIKEGRILVNSTKVTPHHFLSAGDRVSVSTPRLRHSTTPSLPALPVLFENEDVIVVDKPAGLLVHRTSPERKEPNVADLLVKTHPRLRRVGDDPTRPGLVHRLDKLASGVLIVAKTPEAFVFLKQQFSQRLVRKEYLVLAYGRLSKDADTIRLKLARSKTSGRMVARPEEGEGKEAVTHYDVLERFKTATLARVRIETGRTHQIRAHFRAIDHPVVGDPLYKKARMKNIRPIPLDRLFLHAHQLTITLPGGDEKTFTAPLPGELETILKVLPKG